jgi:hypothetical protein
MINPQSPRDARQGRSSGPTATKGFTYVVLLIGLAVTSLAGLHSVQSVEALVQRQTREHMRWVGEQYRLAIGRYVEATPGNAKRYPTQLRELLLDPRYLTVRRHARVLYANPYVRAPLEPAQGWTLVRAPDGGIQGVQATDHEGTEHRFVYIPTSVAPRGAIPIPSPAR